MIERKGKVSFLGLLFISLGLCLILSGCFLKKQVSDYYQYVVPAEDMSETWQKASKVAGKLADVVDIVSVAGRKQDIHLQGIRKETAITLYAIDSNYTSLYHEQLVAGRMVSDGDVQKQRNVIVIDQDTAYTMFSGGNALGKIITINHVDWIIIGIVSAKTRLGETTAGIAFVPITVVASQAIPMDTVEICLLVTGETSKASLIRASLERWYAGGSFYVLEQEKYAATMPLRWISIVIILLCTINLFHRVIQSGKRHYLFYRQRLETHYAQQFITWTASVVALFLLLSIAAICMMMLSMKLITAPVLAFPDWIPENPVSFSSYATVFWKIHHRNAKAIQYITREKSIVTLASWLVHWGTIALLGGSLVVKQKWRSKK